MEKLFERLREFYGSHRAAAKALGVSYTRYNEWRWRTDKMPERAKNHVTLAARQIETRPA